MASPKTIGGASIGMSLVGGLMDTYGTSESIEAQASSLMYRAAVADLNKKIALQNRDFAFDVGEDKAIQLGLSAADRMGKIKAGQGASGLDVASGSNLDVQRSQEYITRRDMAALREDTARVAYGYEVKAKEAEISEEGFRRGVRDVYSSRGPRIAGSLISTATTVADKWLQGKQEGLW